MNFQKLDDKLKNMVNKKKKKKILKNKIICIELQDKISARQKIIIEITVYIRVLR